MPARIAVVHADRPPGLVTAASVERLRAAGAAVDYLTAGGPVEVTDLPAGYDLFVLKHSYGPALSLGAALHAAGARLLNPYPAVAACRDKAVTCGILARAGLPVPRTHLVADPRSAAGLLDGGPVVVKPNTGSKGRGVVVARSEADLAGVDPARGPFVVQAFHPHDGLDRKLYRIGDEIRCVGRRWPAATLDDKIGFPVEVDPELRRLTLAVGVALGIDLYGVDVVVGDDGHHVVDVSAFPGFKGVADADRLLADHILAIARFRG